MAILSLDLHPYQGDSPFRDLTMASHLSGAVPCRYYSVVSRSARNEVA